MAAWSAGGRCEATLIGRLAALLASAHPALQALVLTGFWCATRSFRGITHDARLYAAQAIHGQGDRLTDDLFFAFGSQDSFTIFSALYRPLISAVGLESAHLALTIVGTLGWLASLRFLFSRLFSDRPLAIFASIAVTAGYAGYGGLAVFQYGEPFATPRLFVEAITLCALAFSLARHWPLAGVLMAGAATLHPIMAAAGAGAVALLFIGFERRRWLIAGSGLLGGAGVVIILAVAGVQPFDRLLLRFDPQWLEIVLKRCAMAFAARWSIGDYIFLLGGTGLIVSALPFARPAEQRVLVSVLVAGVGGYVVTVIGADALHNVLLVNLQPWRALWLVTLFTNACAALMLTRLPAGALAREALLCGLTLSALTIIFHLSPVGWGLLAAVSAAAAILEPRCAGGAVTALRVSMRAMIVLSILVTLLQLYGALGRSEFANWALGLAALLCLVGLIASLVGPRVFTVVALLASAAALAAHADGRDPWQRYIEDPTPSASLEAFTAGGGQTYWEAGAMLQWLKLRRSAYYSCIQGAGVMFYRDTALEFDRRGDVLHQLNTWDFDPSAKGLCVQKIDPVSTQPPSRDALGRACRALPDLDTIILTTAVAGTTPMVWRAPETSTLGAGQTRTEVNTYYRYGCDDLRASPREATP